MIRMASNEDSILPIEITRPDLITARTGEVKRDTLLVGAKAGPVRQSFAWTGELLRIRAVQFHVVELANSIADDLDQHSILPNEQLRSVENGHSISCRNLRQIVALQIIDPQMCWRLSIVFF